MNKQKIKSSIKETIISTYTLLKSFKWYVGFNLFFIAMIADEYFNPPAKDDPIFSAEAFSQDWEYTNLEIYVETSKLLLIIYILCFLLATSNMRNHPRLAKLLFLIPWFDMLCGMISALFA